MFETPQKIFSLSSGSVQNLLKTYFLSEPSGTTPLRSEGGTDGQTDIRQPDPVLVHFGAATLGIPENVGFRS